MKATQYAPEVSGDGQINLDENHIDKEFELDTSVSDASVYIEKDALDVLKHIDVSSIIDQATSDFTRNFQNEISILNSDRAQ